MLKLVVPVVLMAIGSGAGIAAGVFLRPPPVPEMHGEEAQGGENPRPAEEVASASSLEYAKLNNQFVIPVVKDGKVASLVVLALSIEVPEGKKDAIFLREPKLRDFFLQILFDHANVGGFDGFFTDVDTLRTLRNALREGAQKVMGKENVSDVLIIEIARQDY